MVSGDMLGSPFTDPLSQTILVLYSLNPVTVLTTQRWPRQPQVWLNSSVQKVEMTSLSDIQSSSSQGVQEANVNAM